MTQSPNVMGPLCLYLSPMSAMLPGSAATTCVTTYVDDEQKGNSDVDSDVERARVGTWHTTNVTNAMRPRMQRAVRSEHDTYATGLLLFDHCSESCVAATRRRSCRAPRLVWPQRVWQDVSTCLHTQRHANTGTVAVWHTYVRSYIHWHRRKSIR